MFLTGGDNPALGGVGVQGQARPASIPDSSLTGPNILVVEDKALIAMLLDDVLEDTGCPVTVAHDGHGALDAAGPGAARFNAVVVIPGLPGLNGTKVIACLRIARPLLPVLVVTGSVLAERDGPPRFLLAGGPTAVMLKPFDPDALV
jgi:CheY-like chemotaxis protein